MGRLVEPQKKPLPEVVGNDLLAYIYGQWKAETKKDVNDRTGEFLEFARDWISKNPPVGFEFMSAGYGITFSNGDRVTFIPQSDGPEYQMYSGEVAITNTNRGYNMQPSFSIQV